MSAEPVVSVDGLTKTFSVARKAPGLAGALRALVKTETATVTAVDGVSFSLNPGEMVGYIGPNGAGKSTTIKMLTGILTPTSGLVRCNGFDPHRERRRYTRTIGVVFGQRTQLWWDIAVVESFRLLREIYGVSEGDYDTRMKELDALLEIGRYLHQPVRKLSLGERMRCDLAASLLHAPPLLFLDEPTIGLDVVAKANVRAFLKQVNQRSGTTVILTTHDLNDIEELCRRVILIDRGRLLYDGSLQGLRDTHLPESRITFDLTDLGAEAGEIVVAGTAARKTGSNRYVCVVDKRRTTPAEVIRELVNRYPVVDLSVSEPDIEEVVSRIYRESAAQRPPEGADHAADAPGSFTGTRIRRG